jgi:hypothetical protein
MYRRRYRKYPNIYVFEKSSVLAGDFLDHMDDVKAGKVFYDYMRHKSAEMCQKDIKLQFYSSTPAFKIVTPKAQKEFANLVPSKIDRYPDEIGFGKTSFEGTV